MKCATLSILSERIRGTTLKLPHYRDSTPCKTRSFKEKPSRHRTATIFSIDIVPLLMFVPTYVHSASTVLHMYNKTSSAIHLLHTRGTSLSVTLLTALAGVNCFAGLSAFLAFVFSD